MKENWRKGKEDKIRNEKKEGKTFTDLIVENLQEGERRNDAQKFICFNLIKLQNKCNYAERKILF